MLLSWSYRSVSEISCRIDSCSELGSANGGRVKCWVEFLMHVDVGWGGFLAPRGW